MIITEAMITELMTVRGGFTGAALYILNGRKRATKGWKRRIVGNEISSEEILQIVKANERLRMKQEKSAKLLEESQQVPHR